MKIDYDSEVDIMDIYFQEGKYKDYEISEETSRGVIVDYSKEGEILSIEILDASKKISKKELNRIKTA